MFILRTTEPTSNSDLWVEFVSITREALPHILGSSVDDTQWSQAKLPVAMGGLGLRSAEDHAAAAYISSLLKSIPIRQSLLTMSEEDSQIVVPVPLLEMLSDKQPRVSRESPRRL